jgi:hypothetical protein
VVRNGTETGCFLPPTLFSPIKSASVRLHFQYRLIGLETITGAGQCFFLPFAGEVVFQSLYSRHNFAMSAPSKGLAQVWAAVQMTTIPRGNVSDTDRQAAASNR